MSERPPEGEPSDHDELDDLADRLGAGFAGPGPEEPVAPVVIRRSGGRSLVGRTLAGTALVLLIGFAFGGTTVAVILLAVLTPLGALLGWLLGRALVEVDDSGVRILRALGAREVALAWEQVVEIGWWENTAGGMLMAVRPHGDRWAVPGPSSPLLVGVAVHGEAERARIRDALDHACRRWDVTFTEDESAAGSASPGSPLR